MSWRFFGGGSDKKLKHERKKQTTEEEQSTVSSEALKSKEQKGQLKSSDEKASVVPETLCSEDFTSCAYDVTAVANDAEVTQQAEILKDGEKNEKNVANDTYDILEAIEKTSLDNKRMLIVLVKRNKLLEQRLDEYDKLFSRLTEYLDVQQIQDARAHNRLLRLGMPVPFRSTQTDRVGMERVPSHSADRWQSVAQGPMIHRNSILSHYTGQPMCSVGVHRDI